MPMRLPLPIAHLAALLSCLFLSAPLHAEKGATEQLVTFSGFGTLGTVHNQGDGSAFSRDITQPNGATNRGLFWEVDSRIGLQANIKPTEYLEGVAQVVSRYRSENNFQPELTWGFIKYSPSDTVDVRAGRVGFDVFLGADSRDVGYSYLWVRPPVEYYGDILAPYLDGGDIAFRAPVGDGFGRLKMFSGLARQQVPFLVNQNQWAGNVTLSTGSTNDLSGSRIIGGLLEYQDKNWTLRLSQADFRVNVRFNSKGPFQFDAASMLSGAAQAQTNPALASSLNALADDIALPGKHITFTSLGLAYENGPFRTQTALSHYRSESLLFAPADAGYLSVGYRYGKFTPYAVISAIRSKKSSRADELAGQGVDSIVNIVNFMLSIGQQVQHTYSLGTRYDLMSNVALKFQVDMIRNGTCSPVSLPIIGPAPPCTPPLLWKSVPVSWDGRANVYSAVLDFTF